VQALDRFRLEKDPWLSSILERRAWRVAAAGSSMLDTLNEGGAQFATAKIDTTATSTVAALEGFGFHVIDTALAFDAERARGDHGDKRVRFARPEDQASVTAIAGSAFRFSRFHLDPAIPDALADRVKAEWASNWFRGVRGDGMVVAEEDGHVVGFLQLLWHRDRLVIDLIAVASDNQGRGLARAMIRFAAERGTGHARRPAAIAVGTQAANIPSVRLYESLGFRLRSSQYVLHHHGNDQACR
jgi:ribosomal protein S18 acetylase RimI-like enzyme